MKNDSNVISILEYQKNLSEVRAREALCLINKECFGQKIFPNNSKSLFSPAEIPFLIFSTSDDNKTTSFINHMKDYFSQLGEGDIPVLNFTDELENSEIAVDEHDKIIDHFVKLVSKIESKYLIIEEVSLSNSTRNGNFIGRLIREELCFGLKKKIMAITDVKVKNLPASRYIIGDIKSVIRKTEEAIEQLHLFDFSITAKYPSGVTKSLQSAFTLAEGYSSTEVFSGMREILEKSVLLGRHIEGIKWSFNLNIKNEVFEEVRNPQLKDMAVRYAESVVIRSSASNQEYFSEEKEVEEEKYSLRLVA